MVHWFTHTLHHVEPVENVTVNDVDTSLQAVVTFRQDWRPSHLAVWRNRSYGRQEVNDSVGDILRVVLGNIVGANVADDVVELIVLEEC